MLPANSNGSQFASPSHENEFLGTAQQLYHRTCIFKISNKTRPLFRDDFLSHVSNIVKQEEVNALLTTGRNDLWHIVLATDDAKKRLLMAGDFAIDDMFVKVSSVGEDDFHARIHWLPLYIPMELVLTALGRSATVVSSKFERTREGSWKGTATGVRSVLLKGNLNDVPHLLEIPFRNGHCSALVTITGRKPVCLRCQRVGHFRKKCRTPKCRHCHLFGHESEECSRPKTALAYAAVVTGPVKDLLLNEDEQDERHNQEDDTPHDSQSILTGLNQAQATAAAETEAKAGAEKSKAEAEVKEVAVVRVSTEVGRQVVEGVAPVPSTHTAEAASMKRKEMFGSDSSIDSLGVSAEEGFQSPRRVGKAMKPTWNEQVETSNSFEVLQCMEQPVHMEVIQPTEVQPTRKVRMLTEDNRAWQHHRKEWVHVEDALVEIQAHITRRAGEVSAAYTELKKVEASYVEKIEELKEDGLL